jgi:hypothetical protein
MPTVRHDQGDYTAQILWAPVGSHYPAGGHDIRITASDIYKARELVITTDIATALIDASTPKPHSGRIHVGGTFFRTDYINGQRERTEFEILRVMGGQVTIIPVDHSYPASDVSFRDLEHWILLERLTDRINAMGAAE